MGCPPSAVVSPACSSATCLNGSSEPNLRRRHAQPGRRLHHRLPRRHPSHPPDDPQIPQMALNRSKEKPRIRQAGSAEAFLGSTATGREQIRSGGAYPIELTCSTRPQKAWSIPRTVSSTFRRFFLLSSAPYSIIRSSFCNCIFRQFRGDPCSQPSTFHPQPL